MKLSNLRDPEGQTPGIEHGETPKEHSYFVKVENWNNFFIFFSLAWKAKHIPHIGFL
jgi:hypothetical protein